MNTSSPAQRLASTLGLKDAQLAEIRRFAQKNPAIERVSIYGSRAKGNYRPGSDVDLVLEGKELKLTNQLSFWNDLDDSDQPYFFDTIILHHIQNDSLLEHIRRVGVVIYQKEG